MYQEWFDYFKAQGISDEQCNKLAIDMSQITDIMAEEIKDEIDKEILNNILNNSGK